MYRNGMGYYEPTAYPATGHSIAPLNVLTLAATDCNLGCPNAGGLSGLGAFELPSLPDMSSLAIPGGALGLAAVAAGAWFLWRTIGKKSGGGRSSALRRARYKAEAERNAILAKG